MSTSLNRFAFVVSASVAFMAPHAVAYDRVTGAEFASRSEVIAPHAMAATSQPLATQIALDVMKQGGSAVDAAIAANARTANPVRMPHSRMSALPSLP